MVAYINWGVPFVGVRIMRAILFGVYIGALIFGNLYIRSESVCERGLDVFAQLLQGALSLRFQRLGGKCCTVGA